MSGLQFSNGNYVLCHCLLSRVLIRIDNNRLDETFCHAVLTFIYEALLWLVLISNHSNDDQ